jgi:hypothetical protein
MLTGSSVIPTTADYLGTHAHPLGIFCIPSERW